MGGVGLTGQVIPCTRIDKHLKLRGVCLLTFTYENRVVCIFVTHAYVFLHLFACDLSMYVVCERVVKMVRK